MLTHNFQKPNASRVSKGPAECEMFEAPCRMAATWHAENCVSVLLKNTRRYRLANVLVKHCNNSCLCIFGLDTKQASICTTYTSFKEKQGPKEREPGWALRSPSAKLGTDALGQLQTQPCLKKLQENTLKFFQRGKKKQRGRKEKKKGQLKTITSTRN